MLTQEKDKRILGDIFDRIEKDVKGNLKEVKTVLVVNDIFDRINKELKKSSALKKYIPPKVERIELSHAIINLIKTEVFKNFQENRVVIESKEPVESEKQVESMGLGKTIFNVMNQLNAIQSKSDVDTKELIKIREEYEKLRNEYDDLKSELKRMRDHPDVEVRLIHAPFPDKSKHLGEFLTNDAQNVKWGPIYDNEITPVIPIGHPNVDGSWRIIVSGTALSIQKRESGSWNEKGGYVP